MHKSNSVPSLVAEISKFLLFTELPLHVNYQLNNPEQKLLVDWVDVQTDLSLHWAQNEFSWSYDFIIP